MLTSSSNLALGACPVTSVAEQRPRPLFLPGLLTYTGREAGICLLPGSLIAKCPFPQAFTMGESPGCCSVWAHCLHCLYSCHWKKCPKDRTQTNQVKYTDGVGLGGRSPRQRPLGGDKRARCVQRQRRGGDREGRGFLSPGGKSPQTWKELPAKAEHPHAWQEAPLSCPLLGTLS